MKLIVLLSLFLSVNADIFTPPNCINNYTTFMDQSYNFNNYELIKNYSYITANDCATYCNNLNNCSSFNYYPVVTRGNLKSECELLNLQFNQSFLSRNIDRAYYLKSINDCSVDQRNIYLVVIFLVLISLLGMACCCMTRYCRQKREGYTHLN